MEPMDSEAPAGVFELELLHVIGVALTDDLQLGMLRFRVRHVGTGDDRSADVHMVFPGEARQRIAQELRGLAAALDQPASGPGSRGH